MAATVAATTPEQGGMGWDKLGDMEEQKPALPGVIGWSGIGRNGLKSLA